MKYFNAENRLPYNKNLGDRAKELRKNMTPAEKKLWYQFLSKQKIRFLRQRPIDNFIVDFYCAKLKLVVELDGDQHFTEEGKIYDQERDNILKSYGLKILRFTNTEVIQHFEKSCKIITECVTPSLRGSSEARGECFLEVSEKL